MSIEDYEFQLEQVKTVLEADPDNEELLKLRKDLSELLELLKAEQSNSQPAPVKEKKPAKKHSSTQFLVGDMVLAKWSDGSFYEAMVVEADYENGIYECVFTGYESIQKLTSQDLKEPVSGQPRPTLLSSKEVQVGEIKSSGAPKQKKKRVKKEKTVAKRDLEDIERTNAWKSFQAKTKKPFGGVGKSLVGKEKARPTSSKSKNAYQNV